MRQKILSHLLRNVLDDNHLQCHNIAIVCFYVCTVDVSDVPKWCFIEGLNEGVSKMLMTAKQGHHAS